MNNLQKLIKEFLEYCEIERGHSRLTIINYQHYLERFLDWGDQKNPSTRAKLGTGQGIKTPEQITLDVVTKYRLFLNRLSLSQSNSELSSESPKNHMEIPDRVRNDDKNDEKTLSKNTQNYHIIALRSFLKYLARHDIDTLSPEKIELTDTDDRQITFLEEEEIERLLSAPDTKNTIGLRDRAILEVLFSTGLRVSELVNLGRDKINLDKKEFSVLGKGGKTRLVFLSDRAQIALSDYLAKRLDKDEAVFVRHDKNKFEIRNSKFEINSNDQNTKLKNKSEICNLKSEINNYDKSEKRLTSRTIQRIIQKYSIKAGITKKVTPHVLRHSFGTDLLRSGADIRAVQQLLGHASITTTQIYTHVTDQHLRDVHSAFHGLRCKKT